MKYSCTNKITTAPNLGFNTYMVSFPAVEFALVFKELRISQTQILTYFKPWKFN